MRIVFKRGDSFMGSIVRPFGLFMRLTVWVQDDEPIRQLQIINDSGRVADEINDDDEPTEVIWQPWVRLFGRNYFYLKVIGDNKLEEGDETQTAVPAPIWIEQ